MMVYHDFMAVLPNTVVGAALLLASVLTGYGVGLQIAHHVASVRIETPPSEGDDSTVGMYIPIEYLEVSDPPEYTQRTVTVDCVAADGSHVQTTPEACGVPLAPSP